MYNTRFYGGSVFDDVVVALLLKPRCVAMFLLLLWSAFLVLIAGLLYFMLLFNAAVLLRCSTRYNILFIRTLMYRYCCIVLHSIAAVLFSSSVTVQFHHVVVLLCCLLFLFQAVALFDALLIRCCVTVLQTDVSTCC
jgi:dolichyl-phosphate-mannose--protein O-mannosyl transferase